MIWGAREQVNKIRIAKDFKNSLVEGSSKLVIQKVVHAFDEYMYVTTYNTRRIIDLIRYF